jgi:autoinducer 2-degrading protein
MAYVVIARWTAKDGEEEAVAAALSNLIEPSRAEPGNLAYVVHRDPADPRRFVIYERYVDAAAFEAHAASEHFKRHGLEDGIPRLESRECEFLVSADD